MTKKPKFDDVTGCTHIENLVTPTGIYRVCAACGATMPNEIMEEHLLYCYHCGETFDHFDDEPREGVYPWVPQRK